MTARCVPFLSAQMLSSGVLQDCKPSLLGSIALNERMPMTVCHRPGWQAPVAFGHIILQVAFMIGWFLIRMPFIANRVGAKRHLSTGRLRQLSTLWCSREEPSPCLARPIKAVANTCKDRCSPKGKANAPQSTPTARLCSGGKGAWDSNSKVDCLCGWSCAQCADEACTQQHQHHLCLNEVIQ